MGEERLEGHRPFLSSLLGVGLSPDRLDVSAQLVADHGHQAAQIDLNSCNCLVVGWSQPDGEVSAGT